jgi:hypothetical protein
MYLVVAFIMQLTLLGEDFSKHSYESCSSKRDYVN